jgi:hypothetical protein
MKTEISRDSHQTGKRYTGVYQQQGRMLTDSDWNELVDILKQRLGDSLKDVVGSKSGSMGGTPRQRALRVIGGGSDIFKIQPGHVYVDGQAAQVPGNTDIVYGAQTDFPSAPPLIGDYVLYADVWERTVTQLMDTRLRDMALHGADTCTRKQMIAQVKWGPYDKMDPAHADNNPEHSVKNPVMGNAELGVTLTEKATSPDPCDPCAAELGDDSITGNYLFRVEVHDVQGDANAPTQIMLKWSSENGAVQFEALAEADMPTGFVSDKWAYEFFDETSEKHLGVHLDHTRVPVRGVLTEVNSTTPYGVATIPDSSETRKFVRRWDGYCTLNLATNTLTGGVDKGVPLAQKSTAETLGDVSVGASMRAILDSIRLDLNLAGQAFVAGDFWLAEVREQTHTVGSKLLENETPHGIEHHYLVLGKVVDGALVANPEADRKYAFPSLSEMTRLFMAGGDGQEIMPGAALPQPLRVGVANGEWPVAGATVRFQRQSGGGSLNPADGLVLTDADGIAECEWLPDAVMDGIYRVKASLIDPDDAAIEASDFDPPVYFYANLISADQVAYAEGCPADSGNTVHSNLVADPALPALDKGGEAYYTVKTVLDALLCKLAARHIPYNPNQSAETISRWKDIKEISTAGDLSEPNTVQEAIDELITWLESTDIRYRVPDCVIDDAPTVGSGLGLTPGTTKVDEVLDSLLCNFKATALPLDRDAELCQRIKDDPAVNTVQDALNVLCIAEGGGCAITVGRDGTYTSLKDAFDSAELRDAANISICLLADVAGHVNEIEDFALSGKTSISISGNGVAKLLVRGQLSLEAVRISLSGIQFSLIDKNSKDVRGTGSIKLVTPAKGSISVEHCVFSRVYFGTAAKWNPLVKIEGKAELKWIENDMRAIRQDPAKSDFLPRAEEVPAVSRETLKELETLWRLNPYADPEGYDARVTEAAKKISQLQPAARSKWFEKRPVNKIRRLPNTPVRVRPGLPVLGGNAPGVPARPPARPPATTERMALAIAISPREGVTDFYDLIKTGGVLEVAALAEAIRTVAKVISKVDYALTLASNEVSGWITNNQIQGYIGLHFGQGKGRISWPPTKPREGEEIKFSWAAKNLRGSLSTREQLNIHGNRVEAVHSMIEEESMKLLQKILRDGSDPGGVSIPAYQSITVRDNVFFEAGNSFTGGFLNLGDNQFFDEGKAALIQAFAIGVRCMFLGNIAYATRAGKYEEYRIEQISEEFPMHAAMQANFLRII